MKRTAALLGIALALVIGVSSTIGQGRQVRVAVDPPCFDNVNRYVDCANGTVTDTVTNLVWLQDASCTSIPGLGGQVTASYSGANEAAAQLQDGVCGLSDGSAPGEWRLPTATEWMDTIARAVTLGCLVLDGPSLTDDAGTGCLSAGSSAFVGVSSGAYWSSSSIATDPDGAWYVALVGGVISGQPANKEGFRHVWPVRGASERPLD